MASVPRALTAASLCAAGVSDTGANICAALGIPSRTMIEIERACGKYDLPVDDLDDDEPSSAPAESMTFVDLDTRLNGFGWEDRWDTTSPDPGPRRFTCSRASISVTQDSALGRPASDLFILKSSGGLQAQLVHLESNCIDDLTVSLLQARFIELNP